MGQWKVFCLHLLGKGTGDGDVEKGDISMLKFTTLSMSFVLRPAPALHPPLYFLQKVTFLCEFFFFVNGFSASCRESKRYANAPRSRFPLTDRMWGITFFLPSRPWREKNTPTKGHLRQYLKGPLVHIKCIMRHWAQPPLLHLEYIQTHILRSYQQL